MDGREGTFSDKGPGTTPRTRNSGKQKRDLLEGEVDSVQEYSKIPTEPEDIGEGSCNRTSVYTGPETGSKVVRVITVGTPLQGPPHVPALLSHHPCSPTNKYTFD